MWENGVGLESDDAKAAQLYRTAAEAGLAAAQYNLGVMCAEGRGVEQNNDAAKYWFRKAAELGNAMAQSNLDVMNASNGEAGDGGDSRTTQVALSGSSSKARRG